MKRVREQKSKDLCQYYTKPQVVSKCISVLKETLNINNLDMFKTILEPSYGKGAFLDGVKENIDDFSKVTYIDIDSDEKEHLQDFLNVHYIPPHLEHPFLTIGNPPFGKNSSLAIDFFNKSAKFSDVIAFILPRTFRKISCVNRLDGNFYLVKEIILDSFAFTFEDKDYDVPCVFQIWGHFKYLNKDGPRFKKIALKKTEDFEFCKNSEGSHVCIRRVGVNAGKIFTDNINEKSKESHLFIRILNTESPVLHNLIKLDLQHIECKYDTAGNPSISKDEICRLYVDKYLNK